MEPIVWEYAVLVVNMSQMKYRGTKWVAVAFSGTDQIYARELDDSYWSVPLSEMGEMGWELVGMIPQMSMAQSEVKGWKADIQTPMGTNFFFKRPRSG
jgi:hypothetical protein